jgi:hypothetical protein
LIWGGADEVPRVWSLLCLFCLGVGVHFFSFVDWAGLRKCCRRENLEDQLECLRNLAVHCGGIHCRVLLPHKSNGVNRLKP